MQWATPGPKPCRSKVVPHLPGEGPLAPFSRRFRPRRRLPPRRLLLLLLLLLLLPTTSSALPNPNREFQIAVGTAGPQLRTPE